MMRHRPSRNRPAERRPIRPYPGPANGSVPPVEQDWELVLAGELSDRQGDLTDKLVSVPRHSRGILYFDSCGGNVFVGLALASLIRLRGLDPIAVVVGECSSAALLPFAACRRRYVTMQSTLLFHPMRWQSEEDVRLEEAAEWARHFAQLESELDALLTKLFGLPEELIRQWTRPGRFLTGKELAEAGAAKMLSLFDGDVWSQIRSRETSNANEPQ